MQISSTSSTLSTRRVDPLPLMDSADDPASVSIIITALDHLNISERARMLGRLLASVGPLGLAVIAGGAFAKYVTQSRGHEVPVTAEDAAHATRSQLSDLVRYIQQSDPQLFSGLLAIIGCEGGKLDGLRDLSALSAEPC